ncbi:MAG: acyltransferase [Candidatus Omnitrophica bacterium]|nr:acyltransferase [Candidatus Omnitrophota bacterium]
MKINIAHIILDETSEWLKSIIGNMPSRAGRYLRKLYWSKKFRQCGSIFLYPGCVITSPKNISIGQRLVIMHNCYMYAHNNGSMKIGDRVSINHNVMLGASDNGEIIIGNDVLIGPNVVIRASNHGYLKKDIPINQQGHTGGKIIIEDDVWIGANSVILPNVTIGKGSVIGAGSVVSKDIPSCSLAGGVPAKVIKDNFRV